MLQSVAVEALAGRNGAVVVLDPRNGEVLAMVSNPTFDPNFLEENGDALSATNPLPVLNRATQGLFPPGSTFKTVTAISVLENNVVQSRTRCVTCPGEIVIDGFPIACDNVPQGIGTYPFRDAFAFSVNGIFAPVGDMLGWERLLATARPLGFDSSLDRSRPRRRARRSSRRARRLSRTLLASTAFGQGELLATPLQMAVVAAAVANGGVLVSPHLGLDVVENGAPARALEIADERTRDGRKTSRRPSASSWSAWLITSRQTGSPSSGVKIAGKTGTAETGRDTSHAWFIAFAPADKHRPSPSPSLSKMAARAGSWPPPLRAP